MVRFRSSVCRTAAAMEFSPTDMKSRISGTGMMPGWSGCHSIPTLVAPRPAEALNACPTGNVATANSVVMFPRTMSSNHLYWAWKTSKYVCWLMSVMAKPSQTLVMTGGVVSMDTPLVQMGTVDKPAPLTATTHTYATVPWAMTRSVKVMLR